MSKEKIQGTVGREREGWGDDVGFDRTINLTPDDFEEFMRIMAEPPQPNDRLRELLRGYTVISQKQI